MRDKRGEGTWLAEPMGRVAKRGTWLVDTELMGEGD